LVWTFSWKLLRPFGLEVQLPVPRAIWCDPSYPGGVKKCA
jgi:hypothetical protein